MAAGVGAAVSQKLALITPAYGGGKVSDSGYLDKQMSKQTGTQRPQTTGGPWRRPVDGASQVVSE